MQAWRLWLGVWAVALAASGCGTAAGNYFANRARDLGDVVRVEVNGALGVGAVVEAGGLLHAGFGGGVKPLWAGAGWCYGEGHAFAFRPHAVRARGSQVAFPLDPIPVGHSLWVLHMRQAPPHGSVHSCWWLLPGLFGESVVGSGAGVSRAPLWSAAALADPTVVHAPPGAAEVDGLDIDRAHLLAAHRWNHVHAFDVSVDVYALALHVGVGVSLGELADFLLGWFGVDFAGDDRPFVPGAGPR
ncbi:MAG: hypothetical protein ACYTGX_15765 [Planctomycetota bacterium]|jgi:hypothetical protein